MVTVIFKLSETGKVEVELPGSQKSELWQDLMARCVEQATVTPGSVIAVRDGKVLQPMDEIVDGDVIDVFPAISGG